MSLARRVKGAVFAGIGAIERTVRPADPLWSIDHFLLLQHPTALGTAVHATPLIPALRHAVPQCRIAVAASGLALAVMRHNPGIDWLIETPSPLQGLFPAARSLHSQLPFGGQPYATLTTMGNERTLISLQSLLAGATRRVGFTEVPQLFQHSLFFDPQRSLIDNNLSIVEALGHPSKHFEPEMFPAPADIAWAEKTLADGGVRPGQMVAVFVTQTSITQRKSWRPERFRAAADFLIEQYGAHILFVGTAAEAAAIEALRARIKHPEATTSVAGATTLPQLAALLSLCRIGLTLDTGTLHVGRTVNLPMVIVAPAWSPVIEWLPVDNPRYRILKNAEMAACPPEYIIDEVSVEEVQAALAELIEAYPAGASR